MQPRPETQEASSHHHAGERQEWQLLRERYVNDIRHQFHAVHALNNSRVCHVDGSDSTSSAGVKLLLRVNHVLRLSYGTLRVTGSTTENTPVLTKFSCRTYQSRRSRTPRARNVRKSLALPPAGKL